MSRAYSFSQWHADFARAFAAAVPMEAAATQARGALLAAENDEPEFGTEAFYRAADTAYAQGAQQRERERIERAVQLEQRQRPKPFGVL
jgi:hypothetical protein